MNDTDLERVGVAMAPLLGVVLGVAVLIAFLLPGCAELRNGSDSRSFFEKQERIKY